MMISFPIGKEEQLMKSIKKRLESLDVQELTEEPLSESLCARIIAKRFLKTWKKMPNTLFRKQSCGNAPLSVCNTAYRFILKQKLKEGKNPKCGSSISSQEAIALGFPGWDPELDHAAQIAWKNTCDQIHGENHKPPDYVESQAN